ncbi:MAG: hypothetical protein HFJ04_07830 [Lachnospiraceae bacterium]|nr:hypothetical protein [Lachnospiraceae bacterium]
MIIVKITAGLCNQMYFFSTAYALAKEWDEELIIDCDIDGNPEWTYLLDEFCMPDCKKAVYPLRYHIGKEYVKITPEIKKKVVIVDETYFEKDGEYLTVPKEKFLQEYPGKDIYLKGTFLARQMFTKYISDLQKIFTLKKPSFFVQEFEWRIRTITAIGVHIRKQGFSVLGDDNGMDFFMAAIAYMRQRFEKARFYIFSDDLDYVKESLGNAEDIFYIDAMNGYRGDIEEFVCLTKCHHYILTRRSTYGRMAEILNPSTKKVSVLFGGNTWNDSEERFYFMSQEEVADWSKLFNRKEMIYNEQWNCPQDMRQIIYLGLDSGRIQKKERAELIFQRAKLYAKEGRCGEAVHLCRLLEDQYAVNSDDIRVFFGNILCRHGLMREALVEYRYLWNRKFSENDGRKHYVIVPYGVYDSQYLCELHMLGLILGRMGNDISFILKRTQMKISEEDVNSTMMSWSNTANHRWLDVILEEGFTIGRFRYGYPCYEYVSVLDNKKEALQEMAAKYSSEETIILGRDPALISKEVPFRKIFVDFSHPFDEAYLKEDIGKTNIAQMYDCADIVVTGNIDYAKEGQVIMYTDNSLLDKTRLHVTEELPYYKPTVYTEDYLDIALKIESLQRM